ncbi:serine/threonine protein kinase [Urbifossiella limnaea]|uniref:Serine/threonine-protein kinase PknB n=1 Tax=Urbifossiella limnaea TaxID=2528023 RepID=A0A517Y016_9BACT|nr:serine/threonine protein kinase [Urbifossiella limnaea]QDU23083.1 Serine/threonine-protein kinase PknB [Urbifossiella limnaea]
MPDDPPTPVMDVADREEARALSARGGRPPAPVPGYERLTYLGRGAYGEVWVGVDSNSGRKVAVKFYTRRGGTDWAALAREVEKLRYLFNSRHVVQLLRVGWDSDPPYYVMEYLENGSLEDLLRGGPLPVGQAVTMFREIALALVYAHDKGVLHCDLKPANVLLDHDRRPRLADFGQARLATEVAPALGTLFYMAPEQADLGAAPDARWDVYALGAVLYRTLTGSPPHRDDPTAGTLPASGELPAQLDAYRTLIRTAPPPKGHRAVPGVDAGLAAVLDKCLAADPARRYPNPQAVVTALDAWRLRRVRRPMLAVTALGFAVLLVLIGGIGAVLFRDAVSTATEEVVQRALEGNRFAAKSAAERLALQVQYRWQVLETEARDPALRQWLAAPAGEFRAVNGGDALDAWLAKRKAKYDAQLGDRSGLWFADAADGVQYGTAPPFPDHRMKYRGFRDYFHGLGKDFAERTGPPPAVIRAPHRSMAFRRKAERDDEYWTVAFSVPVWPHADPGGDPLGVLGLTLDLRGQTRLEAGRDRFVVLVDTRPDATGRRGLLLRHPYLEQYHPSGKEQLPLYYADAVVNRADAGGDAVWSDYADPAGGAYSGSWLAAAERVRVRGEGGAEVDPGFVVLVQERRSEVLHPVADLRGRIALGAGVAFVVVLATVLLMWAGLVAVADGAPPTRVTQLLRRWAGLPPGTNTPGTAPTGESG